MPIGAPLRPRCARVLRDRVKQQLLPMQEIFSGSSRNRDLALELAGGEQVDLSNLSEP